MQNENIKNQQNRIQRNPTRNNTNVNRGPNEKSIDASATTNSNQKTSPSEYDGDENDMAGGGISDSGGSEDYEFTGGPEAGDYDSDEGVSNFNPNQQGVQGGESPTKGGQKEEHHAQQQTGTGSGGEPLGREKNEANQAGAGADYGAASKGARDSEEEDKQMEGGSNKGGQVQGAFGKEDNNSAHQTGGQGKMGNRMRPQTPNEIGRET